MKETGGRKSRCEEAGWMDGKRREKEQRAQAFWIQPASTKKSKMRADLEGSICRARACVSIDFYIGWFSPD